MRPRRSLLSILLAALIPQPVIAFESGVNAMQAAEEYAQQSITAWAFHEFEQLLTGLRHELEPLIPRPEVTFNALDAEIAAFIAHGQVEQTRLQALIEQTTTPEPEAPQPIPDQTMVAQIEPVVIPAFYTAVIEADYMPQVGVLTEDGFLLDIDTSKGINLPDVTVDPRDGGTYETEVTIVQPVFDLMQLVQDQVPDPIQTAGNNLYDKLTGTEGQ